MTIPAGFRLHVAPPRDGLRQAWVFSGVNTVVGLRVDAERRRWMWAREDAAEIEGLVDFIHDRAGELGAAGFNVRRWWHLWRCWECGALPLDPCRHATKGTPIATCHKGRKPRGLRP